MVDDGLGLMGAMGRGADDFELPVTSCIWLSCGSKSVGKGRPRLLEELSRRCFLHFGDLARQVL